MAVVSKVVMQGIYYYYCSLYYCQQSYAPHIIKQYKMSPMMTHIFSSTSM